MGLQGPASILKRWILALREKKAVQLREDGKPVGGGMVPSGREAFLRQNP